MATATSSKLNSKLPTVSKIAFCTAAGKNMATKIFTGENGKFSIKVGFKQNAKTYPFQIQYAQRSRYTNTVAKQKGAQWTNWGAWKNAVAVTGIPIDTTNTTSPVDRWMKANKGVNKNATYLTFYTFTNYMIPATYDAREFKFRIRTFNKAQARHGSWTEATLVVYKRAAVEDETLVTASDGGLKLKFNYIWDRNQKIAINSIKDSSGRELLTKSFNGTLERAYLTNNTTPQPRTGYEPGLVNIPLSRLKRSVAASETLTTDIRFITGDGAETRFSLSTVTDPRRDIDVTTSYTWAEETGLLQVSATNNDSVTLANIGCNVSYTYNDKGYSLSPFSQSIDLTGTSTFNFLPPIGLTLGVTVKEEDAEDYKDVETISDILPTAKGYRLNKEDNPNVCGVAWGNPKYEFSSSAVSETALPHGREKSVIFYGSGEVTDISFTTLIVDKPGLYGGDYGRKQAWDTLRNNQGVYYFRNNRGDMYKVGVRDVKINNEGNDLYNVNVSMVEVI